MVSVWAVFLPKKPQTKTSKESERIVIGSIDSIGAIDSIDKIDGGGKYLGVWRKGKKTGCLS